MFLPVGSFHAAEFSDDLYVKITSQGIAFNEAIAMLLDEWMKNGADENNTIEGKHYRWIRDASERSDDE